MTLPRPSLPKKNPDDVLACAGAWSRLLMLDSRLIRHVVTRQEYDGETHVRVALEFLDDRPAFIGLFVQDNGMKMKALQNAGRGRLHVLVMAVDDKNLVSGGCHAPLFLRQLRLLLRPREWLATARAV